MMKVQQLCKLSSLCLLLAVVFSVAEIQQNITTNQSTTKSSNSLTNSTTTSSNFLPKSNIKSSNSLTNSTTTSSNSLSNPTTKSSNSLTNSTTTSSNFLPKSNIKSSNFLTNITTTSSNILPNPTTKTSNFLSNSTTTSSNSLTNSTTKSSNSSSNSTTESSKTKPIILSNSLSNTESTTGTPKSFPLTNTITNTKSKLFVKQDIKKQVVVVDGIKKYRSLVRSTYYLETLTKIKSTKNSYSETEQVSNLNLPARLIEARRRRVLQALHESNSRIDRLLQSRGVNLNKGVAQLIRFNRSTMIDLKKIRPCYNDRIGKTRLDIFKSSLKDIIHTFITEFRTRKTEIIPRVKNLLHGIKEAVTTIIKCSRLPPHEQNQYGLTRMSAIRTTPSNEELSLGTSHQIGTNQACNFKLDPNETVPEEFDWRRLGVGTPVKFQGNCNSCYIFSTLASFECAIIRQQNRTVILSEQAILNCHNNQCNSGYPQDVFQYLVEEGGIEEKLEPYTAKALNSCPLYQHETRYKLRDYCYYQKKKLTDRQLQTLVYKYGPVVAAIDSRAKELKHLKGHFNGKGCTKQVDHAVNIVGWTKKYWIIKNTWAADWGIGGYLYLRRGKNRCGINTLAGVAIL